MKHRRCVSYESVEGGKTLAIYLCHEASVGDFRLDGHVDGDNRPNPPYGLRIAPKVLLRECPYQ
jgi:hypothetical protein